MLRQVGVFQDTKDKISE